MSYVLTIPAYLWALWGLYVLVMGLYRANMEKRLGTVAKVMGAPFLALGWAMDVLCNLTLASIVFAEVPHEVLLTQRLNRYMHAEQGWRRTFAEWLCNKLLDPFDPSGKHCR